MSLRHALLIFLLVEIARPGYAATAFVRVPDGNVEALKAAIEDAYTPPANTTVIRLGGTFQFDPDDPLPEVRTAVFIYADSKPAYFVGRNGGPANLLSVAPAGSLTLTNVSFEGFDPRAGGGSPGAGLIVNEGTLRIQQAQFRNNLAQLACSPSVCSVYKPLILNTADGEFNSAQVSVVDSGVTTLDSSSGSAPGAVLSNLGAASLQVWQLYLQPSGLEPVFHNSGQMGARNFTVKSEARGGQQPREWIVSPGRLQLANSIIEGFSAGWCETVISAGYNLVDNPDCAIASPGDIVGSPTGLRWQAVNAHWIGALEDQILTHALAPIAGSPAVDSGNDDWCPETSLQADDPYVGGSRALDGDNDGMARCDRGAYEVPLTVVENGGINGLYYNPDTDGHYVYIADTRNNTMVMWTTFDAEGRQAWVFGIAKKNAAGRSFIADAWINRDGRVSLSGDFDPAISERWGYIEVDLTNCDEGTLVYSTDYPGFYSGEFPIRRLAHLERLGCEDYPVEN